MKKLLPTFLTVAALGTVGAQGAAIHAGLLNYWALDSDASDTAGSFAESTGATTDNGSVNGSTSFAAGLFGNAASFPGGAGNNITVADSAASSAGGLADDIDRTGSDMTLSVWFKASAWTTNWQAIVSHGEGQDYRIARQNNLNPVQLAGVIGTSDIVTTAGYGALDGSDATWQMVEMAAFTLTVL